MRFAPIGFSPAGAPKYSWAAGKSLSTGAQSPTTSGGDQALAGSDGWAVLTVAPQPFAPQSLGGAQNGVPKWSYPSLWPGLHASHESPPPDRPGMVIGTTRLLGGFITPKLGDGGPLWMINGNQGNIYCFTQDGLFVATLFKDVRQGGSFSMPIAQRNMKLNDQSLHDENFWPSVTQTPEGKIYLVEGGRTSLVRVDGLETIRRIAPTDLTVSATDLKAAAQWQMREEVRRQKEAGPTTLKVLLRADAPLVDGKLDDWSSAQWASIDKSGTAAYFDSNTKPYDVQGAVSIADGKLFAAWKTGDENLLRNSGEIANAPFKTGGALDLMIGANPKADPNRSAPTEGDMRLLITRVGDKTRAVLYRAIVVGTTTPVPFSSPSRTIKLDRVEDISDKVLWSGTGGNFEISVPLETLGLKPQAATSIKGDIGILRGNGVQTIQRVYWSNKATAIVSDVPSEAELTPRVWGQWDFIAP